jgi:hypothetical protein
MSDSAILQPVDGVTYRPLSTVRARFPGTRTNGLLHLSTLIRWCTRGIRLPDGSRVRLRSIRVGCRWLTTDAWVDEFIAVLTAAHVDQDDTSTIRTPARRQLDSEAAGRKLTEKYGI